MLHVGPKIVGVKDTGSAKTVSPLSDGIEDDMSDIDMLEVRTSAAEKLFVPNENARRIRSKKILEAWKKPSRISPTLPSPATSNFPINYNNNVASLTRARVNQIQRFLLVNRRILAFDTMHFPIGEHVFLGHIHRLDGPNIKHDELRSVPVEMGMAQTMFS